MFWTPRLVEPSALGSMSIDPVTDELVASLVNASDGLSEYRHKTTKIDNLKNGDHEED